MTSPNQPIHQFISEISQILSQPVSAAPKPQSDELRCQRDLLQRLSDYLNSIQDRQWLGEELERLKVEHLVQSVELKGLESQHQDIQSNRADLEAQIQQQRQYQQALQSEIAQLETVRVQNLEQQRLKLEATLGDLTNRLSRLCEQQLDTESTLAPLGERLETARQNLEDERSRLGIELQLLLNQMFNLTTQSSQYLHEASQQNITGAQALQDSLQQDWQAIATNLTQSLSDQLRGELSVLQATDERWRSDIRQRLEAMQAQAQTPQPHLQAALEALSAQLARLHEDQQQLSQTQPQTLEALQAELSPVNGLLLDLRQSLEAQPERLRELLQSQIQDQQAHLESLLSRLSAQISAVREEQRQLLETQPQAQTQAAEALEASLTPIHSLLQEIRQTWQAEPQRLSDTLRTQAQEHQSRLESAFGDLAAQLGAVRQDQLQLLQAHPQIAETLATALTPLNSLLQEIRQSQEAERVQFRGELEQQSQHWQQNLQEALQQHLRALPSIESPEPPDLQALWLSLSQDLSDQLRGEFTALRQDNQQLRLELGPLAQLASTPPAPTPPAAELNLSEFDMDRQQQLIAGVFQSLEVYLRDRLRQQLRQTLSAVEAVDTAPPPELEAAPPNSQTDRILLSLESSLSTAFEVLTRELAQANALGPPGEAVLDSLIQQLNQATSAASAHPLLGPYAGMEVLPPVVPNQPRQERGTASEELAYPGYELQPDPADFEDSPADPELEAALSAVDLPPLATGNDGEPLELGATPDPFAESFALDDDSSLPDAYAALGILERLATELQPIAAPSPPELAAPSQEVGLEPATSPSPDPDPDLDPDNELLAAVWEDDFVTQSENLSAADWTETPVEPAPIETAPIEPELPLAVANGSLSPEAEPALEAAAPSSNLNELYLTLDDLSQDSALDPILEPLQQDVAALDEPETSPELLPELVSVEPSAEPSLSDSPPDVEDTLELERPPLFAIDLPALPQEAASEVTVAPLAEAETSPVPPTDELTLSDFIEELDEEPSSALPGEAELLTLENFLTEAGADWVDERLQAALSEDLRRLEVSPPEPVANLTLEDFLAETAEGFPADGLSDDPSDDTSELSASDGLPAADDFWPEANLKGLSPQPSAPTPISPAAPEPPLTAQPEPEPEPVSESESGPDLDSDIIVQSIVVGRPSAHPFEVDEVDWDHESDSLEAEELASLSTDPAELEVETLLEVTSDALELIEPNADSLELEVSEAIASDEEDLTADLADPELDAAPVPTPTDAPAPVVEREHPAQAELAPGELLLPQGPLLNQSAPIAAEPLEEFNVTVLPRFVTGLEGLTEDPLDASPDDLEPALGFNEETELEGPQDPAHDVELTLLDASDAAPEFDEFDDDLTISGNLEEDTRFEALATDAEAFSPEETVLEGLALARFDEQTQYDRVDEDWLAPEATVLENADEDAEAAYFESFGGELDESPGFDDEFETLPPEETLLEQTYEAEARWAPDDWHDPGSPPPTSEFGDRLGEPWLSTVWPESTQAELGFWADSVETPLSPPDLPPESAAPPEGRWFLGLDFGSRSLAVTLLEANSGQLYPLFWVQSRAGASSETLYSFPCLAYLSAEQLSDERPHSIDPILDVMPVGQAALDAAHDQAGNKPQGLLLQDFKFLFKTGLAYRGASRWEPALQWSEQQTLSLRCLQAALRQVLVHCCEQARAHDLSTARLQQIWQNLAGISLGFPSDWPDTYILNVREVLLSLGWVKGPEQIFLVEDPLAIALSLFADAAPPTGPTLLLDIGADATELALVDLPADPQSLRHSDLIWQRLHYAGRGLEQDIVCQLLYPRLLQSAPSSDLDNDFTLEDLELPLPGEPDPSARSRLRQRLEGSSQGRELLALAGQLKLALAEQDRFNAQLAGQPILVVRREMESQVLLPFIQRLNRELNGLLGRWGRPAEEIHTAVCGGGTAALKVIPRWLRQKLPVAQILETDRVSPASEGRLAQGLALLPLYPNLLDLGRLQYNDYFLLLELLRAFPQEPSDRSLPPAPVSAAALLQRLEQRGINTRVCHQRIQAFLDGQTSARLLPWQAEDQVWLSPDTEAVSLGGPLFERLAEGIYRPNPAQFEAVQSYLTQVVRSLRQNLEEPLVLSPLPQWS